MTTKWTYKTPFLRGLFYKLATGTLDQVFLESLPVNEINLFLSNLMSELKLNSKQYGINNDVYIFFKIWEIHRIN